MYDILDIIRNLDNIYENNTTLAILKDFERVLDEMDIYVYENWIDGELAYGPQVDRHWITVGFMWPKNKMPNPDAAKRLLDLGCKVKYEKSFLVEPRKIKSPEDYRPGTKKGRLDRKAIWIVEIQMPKKVAFDIYRGYMDKMKGELQNAAPKNEVSAPAAPAPIAPGMPGGAPMAPGMAGGAPMAPGMAGGAPMAPGGMQPAV